VTRVGILTTSFPRFDGDIAGHFVLGFARALAALGHSVRVLAPEPAEELPLPSWPGVELHWVRYARPRGAQRTFYGAGVPDNLRRDPRAWLGLAPFSAALALAARRELADAQVLASHWALPCALAAGAIRARRPHLAVVHSADLHMLSKLPLRGALAARVLAGADRICFMSEAQRARFIGLLPAAQRAVAAQRTHVQPMGIDDPEPPAATRNALRRQLGLERFTLLTIARLVPVKGLVQAVTALAHRGDLEWLIAGDGPEAPRLAALAARARLRVRLLGTVTGARKHALLRAADAFVLPSRVLASGRSEGVPTALLEAMAAGTPAVASAVGGIPDLLGTGTGLLFDPCQPRALERSIDRLIAEPGLTNALREQALRAAEGQRWSALAPRIEALLGCST
jgi:glycosyltransferase involved in cell wall biosynthesis